MENSKIEWTDHTFNPWWGCMKVSAGCTNCYAEALDNRYHHEAPHWGPGSERKGMSAAHWKKPLTWDREAKFEGKQSRVFCASMADVFEDHPGVKIWRDALFLMIENTPSLIWQLLTKRPQNIMKMVPRHWTYDNGFPNNVHMGTSVENQEQAEIRIPWLLKTKAHTLFLSCEPFLGPVDLERIDADRHHDDFCRVNALTGQHTDMGRLFWQTRTIDWVIVGAESGHGHRPMSAEWAIGLHDQCVNNGVAFFMKQMIASDGHKVPFSQFPPMLQMRQYPIFVRKNFTQWEHFRTGSSGSK